MELWSLFPMARTHHSLRVIISDGIHFFQGMLATQLNSFVSMGKIDRGTIIRVKECICSAVNGKRYVGAVEWVCIYVGRSTMVGLTFCHSH
jgi:hypothetical protein